MGLFANLMDRGFNAMERSLAVNVTLVRAEDASTETFLCVFNEYVGAVDDDRRGLFTFRSSNLTGALPERTDYLTVEGDTDRWYVRDVRDDKSGGIEIRADGKLSRL